MAAPRIGMKGRFSEFNNAVSAGAELPVTRNFYQDAQAASLTRSLRFYPRAGGRIRALTMYAAITGTVTIDVQKNGVSVLSGTFTLANNTLKALEGLGAGGVGSGFFNTVSDANKKALMYEKGDYILITLTTAATSTITGLVGELTCDEQQPKV